MHKPIKDGTRVLLDSALLNLIFSKQTADEIKKILRAIIVEQPKPVFLQKEFNIKQSDKETHGKIFYYCDRCKCDNCTNIDCEHTSDITHARNFEKDENGNYFEGEYMRG